MAVNNALRFYKGWYGKGSSRHLPRISHAIIFNEEEGIIYVNGKSYAGASDVNFSNGVLTITYSDGRNSVSLDFNDTASATAVFSVIERIEGLIGQSVTDSDSDGSVDYSGTNYLGNQTTLIGADVTLDWKLKEVEDKVTLGANVTFDVSNHDLSVENENGIVFGTDVSSFKDYIKSKSVSITNSNGSNDAISITETVNNDGSKNYDINLLWSEWSGNSQQNEGE